MCNKRRSKDASVFQIGHKTSSVCLKKSLEFQNVFRALNLISIRSDGVHFNIPTVAEITTLKRFCHRRRFSDKISPGRKSLRKLLLCLAEKTVDGRSVGRQKTASKVTSTSDDKKSLFNIRFKRRLCVQRSNEAIWRNE